MTVSDLLLSREAFKAEVFKRDGSKCVFCDAPAVDAHHIFERKLWHDGGYYLRNGASVCSAHHYACETTEITVEEVLHACGITDRLLPPHLAENEQYDKWGNVVLPDGSRLRGELFHEDGVQKVLAAGGVLGQFQYQVKYPRTYHFPWSPSCKGDDKALYELSGFEGQDVVLTEKMDGENTSLYQDGFHARSLDGRHHPSRDWVKGMWSRIAYDIPAGWRICGENLYAQHSVSYADLPSYFLGFSVWNDLNICLSWDETLEWFELLGIAPVKVLWRGRFSEEVVRQQCEALDQSRVEGAVLRTTEAFHYSDFRSRVAKYVRPNHVQTTEHWAHGPIISNQLKGHDNAE